MTWVNMKTGQVIQNLICIYVLFFKKVMDYKGLYQVGECRVKI